MRTLPILFIVACITGCGVSKNSVSPYKKISSQQLKHDFSIYRGMMEESHPSLYWYNSKDSIDNYFQIAESQIKDSMTEPAFRKILAWMTSKFDCGHTAVRSSPNVSRFTDTARLRVFPLSMKIWPATTEQKKSYEPREVDFMAVAATLSRRDTIFKRGTLIRSINGQPVNFIVDTLFEYMTTDGYNRTHKYQTLSNRGTFGSLYTAVFGLSEKYTIDYLDANGQLKTTVIPVYDPSKDTAGRAAIRPGPRLPQPTRKQRKASLLVATRQLKIDSVNHTAYLTLNSFGRGYGLKKFFRQVFLALKKNKISHFIVDVRGNGGGSVTNSTFLTRFLADHRFKIADSLYAPRKKSAYSHYLSDDFFNRLFMTFFCKKKSDGNYHFGYFERHYFKPKKARRFNGMCYIITGGNSFSATTLFARSVMSQENVIVVGEETGGGAYGNSAWLIPDAKLPETKIRLRIPLFRLVIDRNVPKNGRGVQPEVESTPTVDAVRRGTDYKLDKVMELIKQDKQAKRSHN